MSVSIRLCLVVSLIALALGVVTLVVALWPRRDDSDDSHSIFRLCIAMGFLLHVVSVSAALTGHLVIAEPLKHLQLSMDALSTLDIKQVNCLSRSRGPRPATEVRALYASFDWVTNMVKDCIPFLPETNNNCDKSVISESDLEELGSALEDSLSFMLRSFKPVSPEATPPSSTGSMRNLGASRSTSPGALQHHMSPPQAAATTTGISRPAIPSPPENPFKPNRGNVMVVPTAVGGGGVSFNNSSSSNSNTVKPLKSLHLGSSILGASQFGNSAADAASLLSIQEVVVIHLSLHPDLHFASPLAQPAWSELTTALQFTVVKSARETKGHVVSVGSTEFLILWAPPVAQRAYKAVDCAHKVLGKLKDTLHRLFPQGAGLGTSSAASPLLTIGVAQGPALVGITGTIRKSFVCEGHCVTTASLCAKVARSCHCGVVMTEKIAKDVKMFCESRPVEVLKLPATSSGHWTKTAFTQQTQHRHHPHAPTRVPNHPLVGGGPASTPVLLTLHQSIQMRPLNQDDDAEWMYRLQQQEEADKAQLDDLAFDALKKGDLETYRSLMAQLLQLNPTDTYLCHKNSEFHFSDSQNNSHGNSVSNHEASSFMDYNPCESTVATGAGSEALDFVCSTESFVSNNNSTVTAITQQPGRMGDTATTTPSSQPNRSFTDTVPNRSAIQGQRPPPISSINPDLLSYFDDVATGATTYGREVHYTEVLPLTLAYQ